MTARLPAVCAAAMCLAASAVHAQFAAAVNPPRFEIDVAPGQVTRQVLEITNAAANAGSYRVYTADWTMDSEGTLTFFDAIQPGSCRPWVAIERRELSLPANARVRYRFEVAPAADAKPQECRFALMIESAAQQVTGDRSSFPMSGRIAVIVYVSIDGARAQLVASAPQVMRFEDRFVPSLLVRNDGNATGRLSGIVRGIDASGNSIEFAPESVPVLPGQARRIALQPHEAPLRMLPGMTPNAATARAPEIRWPLTIHGALEYGPAGAHRIELDTVYADPARPAAAR